MQRLDLDSHATTALHPAALEAMIRVYRETPGNAASGHTQGRRARRQLDDARERVALHLHCSPESVTFTSGATEANNLAIFGLVATSPHAGEIVASRLEHPCVTGPVEQLAKLGQAVHWARVSSRGTLNLDDALGAVTPTTALVTLMLANHETGWLQPVAELARQLPRGVPLHSDAAQAVGKVSVDFASLGVATLSFSGHKFGGPQGVGVLLVRPGVKLNPRTFGGHQQAGRRPGTEPVALAVGLAAALDESMATLSERTAHLNQLRTLFLETLTASGTAFVSHSPLPHSVDETAGLPSCLNLAFVGCRAELLQLKLDLLGVHTSTGSACASGSALVSPVLEAMGVPSEQLRSALRLSFHAAMSTSEVVEAARRVAEAVATVRG